MKNRKISSGEKEKLREMLKEQSYKRLERLGKDIDEAHAGELLGGLGGRIWFAIVILGLGVFYVLGALAVLSRGLARGWLILLAGVAFLLVGIQNFKKPVLEMLKVNGIALIILGVLSLPVGLIPIGTGIYFLLWHRKRAQYADLRKRR